MQRSLFAEMHFAPKSCTSCEFLEIGARWYNPRPFASG
jgi:hypothetical protein